MRSGKTTHGAGSGGDGVDQNDRRLQLDLQIQKGSLRSTQDHGIASLDGGVELGDELANACELAIDREKA